VVCDNEKSEYYKMVNEKTEYHIARLQQLTDKITGELKMNYYKIVFGDGETLFYKYANLQILINEFKEYELDTIKSITKISIGEFPIGAKVINC
jgi:hypothetical protein